MKTHQHTFGFGWLFAATFALTLVAGSTLSAEEILVETQVAIRPSATIPPAGSPSFDPPPTGTPGFDGDEFHPDFMDGPPPAEPSAAEKRQMEITARYQDSRMLGFLQRTSVNQAASLYAEASRLIDTRHVSPLSYEERTAAAIDGLIAALDNPAFLQAAGYRSAQSPRALQSELAQLKRSPARSANEAIGLMQWSAELANRRLGLRSEAVAVEFLNGTLDALDKYSAFVPAKTGFGPSAILEEQMVGVGVELKPDDDGALINDVLENSPASEGRLQRGDLITGVNGRNVRGMNLGQIADMIGGPSGTNVRLQIERSGRSFTVTLRRRSVYVSSVSGVRMLDRETGYARLKQFSESSAEDLEKAMWGMYRNGMKTMVLDLRGNPGGLLTEAIDVSNLFVPCGRIVATRGRTRADNSDEKASWQKTWRLPLVVLVDENSASASEIFAAAIQENDRGVLVGRRSYGKGTVQTHFPLQTVGGDLKLTTAKFYSPDGREMAGSGVTPDVFVRATGKVYPADPTADSDIVAAMRVVRSGSAAELASNAGTCKTPADSLGF